MKRSTRFGFRRSFVWATLPLATVLVFGCGGGGDDGGGGNVLPSTCVTYTAGASPAGPARVITAAGTSACSTIEVRILAEDVQNVFGAGFDVVYDPDVVRFDSVSFASTHLRSGGADAACLAEDPGAVGRVVTSCTILDALASGVDFPAGGQELCRLRFRKFAQNGSSSLAFENAFLADDNVQPIADVDWGDGTFTVQ